MPRIPKEQPVIHTSDPIIAEREHAVDVKTGIYTDSQGREWMSAKPLARLMGFSSSVAISTSGIASISGIDRLGLKRTLYSVLDAKEKFQYRAELPRVSEESGVYEDDTGKKWMSPSRFSNDFNIPFRQVLYLMKDIPSIKGISNTIVALYPLDILLDICLSYSALPSVDKKTGIYTDPNNGTQWASIHYFAKKFSLFHETVKSYFQRDCVPSQQGKNRTGRQNNLFLITAGDLSLEKIASLPQAGLDGCYYDASGITWVSLKAFESYFDIDASTMERLLSDIPTMLCRNIAKVPSVFYRLDEGRKRIEQYVALPKVDNETCYYEDLNRVRWASIRYFRNKYGIGHTTFESYAGHVQAINGRKQGSGITKLYNIDEAEKALQLFFSLPSVDTTTGMVADTEGVLWTTENGFCNVHEVSRVKFHTMLDSVPTREGRGANGMKSMLYHLDALNKKFEDYLSLPITDKQTGIYRDDSGKEWASLRSISKMIGVGMNKLRKHVSRITSINGRVRLGGHSLLYNIEELKITLRDYIVLPKVDKTTGIYTDLQGEQWMPLGPLASHLSIGEWPLKSFKNISSVRGRDIQEKETDLLCIADAENAVHAWRERRSSAKIIASQEQSASPNVILGKEYEFNGILFTVLGIDPLFFDASDEKSVADAQAQRLPIIPFQGGMARITKIQIGNEVIAGYSTILKRIVSPDHTYAHDT